MHPMFKKILISEEQIVQRSKELGSELDKKFANSEEKPLFVALLKGSVPFLAELIKHIEMNIEIDFMDVSSYEGKGTESTRDIKILKDLDRSIIGENIVLVEDIVDTGRTIASVKKLLMNKGANSVIVVSLLDKPSRREIEIDPEYVGFEIPNEFVVGFGLDFDQKLRNVPYIGVLKEEYYL
jgi:hypoxanthine phosphoribosyltransferase